jgi:hypothetical protein
MIITINESYSVEWTVDLSEDKKRLEVASFQPGAKVKNFWKVGRNSIRIEEKFIWAM